MKNVLKKAAIALVMVSFMYACSPKYGCPSSGKNTGAERYLSGEKVPRAKKFKA